MQPRPLIAGVDIGGTKTAILVCEIDGSTVLARHVAPTAVGAPDTAADSIAAVVTAALAEAGAASSDVAAIGVGVPGRVDRDRGHVTLAVNLDWHDLPLGPRLQARLGIPTFLENDVRAAALGIHRRHIFGDVRSLALLAIGTGISAGVVIDGSLHRGAMGLAGEIGHTVADVDGPRCACGMTGCFEAIAAGPAIAAQAGTPDAEAAFAAATRGDRHALGVIEEAGRAVAWGVHLLALAYDVERIVIGGGVSHAGEPLLAPINRELDRFRLASPLAREILVPGRVQLLPPGADAGAWGAVTIAREALATGTADAGTGAAAAATTRDADTTTANPIAASGDRRREVGHA